VPGFRRDDELLVRRARGVEQRLRHLPRRLFIAATGEDQQRRGAVFDGPQIALVGDRRIDADVDDRLAVPRDRALHPFVDGAAGALEHQPGHRPVQRDVAGHEAAQRHAMHQQSIGRQAQPLAREIVGGQCIALQQSEAGRAGAAAAAAMVDHQQVDAERQQPPCDRRTSAADAEHVGAEVQHRQPCLRLLKQHRVQHRAVGRVDRVPALADAERSIDLDRRCRRFGVGNRPDETVLADVEAAAAEQEQQGDGHQAHRHRAQPPW